MGLGALLVLGGVLYMARATIWRGSLSRPARGHFGAVAGGRGILWGSKRTGPGSFSWQSVQFSWYRGPVSSPQGSGQREFEDLMRLPDGRKLVTLRDAAGHITKLPKKESDLPEWRTAIETRCSLQGTAARR